MLVHILPKHGTESTVLQPIKLISHTNCLEDVIFDTKKDDSTREFQFENKIDALTDDDKNSIGVAYYQWENIR